MIDEEVIKAFREKYNNIHPLVFHRSIEKAENANELFDILESIPKYPFYWDDSNGKWAKISDFYFISKAKSILSVEKED